MAFSDFSDISEVSDISHNCVEPNNNLHLGFRQKSCVMLMRKLYIPRLTI